ncbi:conserved hypothetical protein [Candidatus Zixiibacteriota bacterium]|nr:conserved hypothetical protein [candidate division Zixibacteria bacterium]
MQYHIRPVLDIDASSIIEIFNCYVDNSFAAFPDKEVGIEFFDTLKNLAAGYPFYVAESESREVVGFALLRPYHRAATCRRTAEITYFLEPSHTGRGIGSMLLSRLENEARAKGIDNILACISSRNEKSIKFHERHGFVECGRFRKVGFKCGLDFDMLWMQKLLS